MRVAVLVLEGCNEMDSFVAFTMLRRVTRPDWQLQLVTPTPSIISGGGITITGQAGIEAIVVADAVLIGSGRDTARYAADKAFLKQLGLNPGRQLIGAQCSGAILLDALGLLPDRVACSDLLSRPALEARGLRVLDAPFYSRGTVAMAGGCLASPYLAAWTILRLIDADAAAAVLHQVAPVGEKAAYVERAMAAISGPS